MMPAEVLCSTLLILGAVFMLIASVGILRLPDLYMRMSATTKATTFGLMLMILSALIFFDDIGAKGRALAIIAFLCLTGPVSAHMIGRAGYLSGVPLWRGTVVDQLAGYHEEQRSHKLDPGSMSSQDEPS